MSTWHEGTSSWSGFEVLDDGEESREWTERVNAEQAAEPDADLCMAENVTWPYVCSRPIGHEGVHCALGTNRALAVWR